MTTDEWREVIAIRYGKALYLGYGKGILYHFFYGYKRILIEIIKSFVYVLLSSFSAKWRKVKCLSLYSTNNQQRALLSAFESGVECGEILPLYRLSPTANFVRLLVWLIKLPLFPLVLFLAKKKEGVYFSLFSWGMRLYACVLAQKLGSLGVQRLCVSNDHAGDIYLLTLALRSFSKVKVAYVQHGAVKPEFPVNYFHEIYVYNQRSADIYANLSCNPEVTIKLFTPQETKEKRDQLDILICFSHQFRILNSLRLMLLFRSLAKMSIGVRFHPSDRLALIKFHFLSVFVHLELSPSSAPFETEAMRADCLLCASSSILVDVYNSCYSEKLIWYKPIGLAWDYYGLERKICAVSNLSDLDRRLCIKN